MELYWMGTSRLCHTCSLSSLPSLLLTTCLLLLSSSFSKNELNASYVLALLGAGNTNTTETYSALEKLWFKNRTNKPIQVSESRRY